MPETIVNTRRWSSYVCPSCRFVFRVQKGLDGEGVSCPNCRQILKIPTPEDSVPPLTVASNRAEQRGAGGEPSWVKKRHEVAKFCGAKDTIWDQQAKSPRSGKGEQRQMRWLLLGGISLFLLMTGGVLISTQYWKQTTAVKHSSGTPVETKSTVPEAIKPAGERSEASYLTEIEPIARKFMQATTVAEILPLVRNPAVAEERMRKIYPDGKMNAPGISQFNPSGELSMQGKVVAVGVRTRDQEEKAIAFVETPLGLKIDWECWATWSEMTWDEFMAARPTDGKVFRVILSPVVYYNFEYSDDSKWKSYSLESPDHEQMIFGYVEKDSAIDKQIQLDPDAKSMSVMLSLKFNPSSTSKNQVEIDRFVADGWVENADAP